MGIAVLVAGVVVVFVRRRRGASWGAPLALAGVGALGVIPPLTPALGARGLPRVHPAPEPHEGALIDVRSKSRDGKDDLGANAARVQRFVGALVVSGA